MSYLNWGSETPEQKKRRAQLEQEEMFNRAVQMKMMEARGVATIPTAVSIAATSAAAGAAGGAPVADLYMPNYYMNNPDEYAY
jgi:hypothetical protein